LAIKEIVRIIGRQVGTFKSANNYIWAAGRHFNICRYYYSGRHVGTLKFADISQQVGMVGTFSNVYNPLLFIYFSRLCLFSM